MPPGATLTPDAIACLNGGDVELKPVLQVLDIRQIGTGQNNVQERFRLVLSDGTAVQQAMLATQLNELVKTNQVQKSSIVQLQEYICNTVQNRKIIIVLNMDVLLQNADLIGEPRQGQQQAAQQPPQQAAQQPLQRPTQQQQYGGSVPHQPPPQRNGSSVPQQQYFPPQPQQYGNFSSQAPQQQQQYGIATPAPAAFQSPARGPTTLIAQQQSPYGRPAPSYSNRGPISLDEAPPQINSIASLNPYQGRWTIKARITAKTEIRRYNNAKGDGRVFSFDLLDGEGGEIRVTCFNAVADQFFERTEVGRTYMVAKGQLKPAQKAFNHLKSEFEIMFDRESVLDPCPDDSRIPQQIFDFKPISEIENVPVNSTVDILGVVISVNPTSTIMRKNGMETQKRSLQLKDMSGKSVELTMWGNFCGREGQELQELFDSGQNPVLAVKAGRVGEFGGKNVGTISSTQFQVNPESQDARVLRQWYEQEGKHAAAQSISSRDGGGGDNREAPRKTVSQIKDENLGRSDRPDWITLMATLQFIKQDNFCYTACPLMVGDRQCNKKVTNNGDGNWRCERCEKDIPECDYRYLLSMQVMDHTGVTWLTGFQEASEELLGVSAKELFAWKQEEGSSRFSDHVSSLQFHHYIFKLRVKEETYNDEQRVKCTIQKAERCDYAAESKYLLELIGKLERGESINSAPVIGTAAPMQYGGGSASGYMGNRSGGFGGTSIPYGSGGATPSQGNGGGSMYAAGNTGGGYGGGNTGGGFGGGNASGGSGGSGTGYGGSSGGGYGSGGGFSGGGGGGGGGFGGGSTLGTNSCFKCGQGGHWARDCPNQSSRGAGFTGGYSSNSGGGGGGGRQGYGGWS